MDVDGGRVTSVRPVAGNAPGGAGNRSAGGRNAGREDREVVWEFEIEPDSDGDVTVSLDAGRPCGEPGAICTADGRSLSEGISTTVEGPDTGPAGLTAAFEGMPEAHDGEGGFRFRVAFSENIGIGFRSLREDAFTVTGGRVTGGRRVDGRRDLFEMTVRPDGDGDVTIALPAGRECGVSGAICTKSRPRRQLTNTPAATVAGPGAAPLTARFVDMPAEHDGQTAFTLRLAFSEAIRMSGRRLRGDVVAVAGGRATKARRVNQRRDLWKLTVEPDSLADVTVTLAAGAACDTPEAVCTADGRALSNTISTTILGPVAVSVADARAEEGTDETIDFAVTLSRAASGPVAMAYTTADGTATAGEDYTRASGTLSFAPGETEKTVAGAGARRRDRRGRGDLHAAAVRRHGGGNRRRDGDGHHRELRPVAEDVAVALRAHGGGPGGGRGGRPPVGAVRGLAGDAGRAEHRPVGAVGRDRGCPAHARRGARRNERR